VGNTVAGSTAYGSGTLNIGVPIPGGSVWVNGPVVEGGGSGDAITNLGGSLKVSGPLGSTASSPSSAGPLPTMTLSNATLTFDLGSTPNPATPWWTVNNLYVTAPVTNNVLGNALTPGQFSLLQYAPGALVGDNGSGFKLGTLPPHINGYLSNNVNNYSIDLVITSVSTPKWNGNVSGGAWDINTTANWLPVSGGGGAITYLQYSVPGDSVLFDDSATGTTTVNLTTTLSPTSITVNNSSKDYTFTGSGSVSNSTGLTKNGSGTLTLSNTGTNTFTGPVAINAGTVRIAGGANLLPTNAAVTLADDPSAVLDLNNNNQMLGSLSGGGATGGNVTLGTGTLTINGGGLAYNGVISGSGSVVKSGSGTEKFTTANLYSGGTLVTGGTLEVANPDGGGSGVGPGSVTVQTNGYFQIGDGGADGSIAVGTITNNGGYVVLNRSDDLTFTNLITGTGGFIKYTNNTVTITNANSYSGQTTIGAGTVIITDPGALGTGLTYINDDGTALLTLSGGITLVQPITVMQKGGGSTKPAIFNQDGTNILAGPITLIGGGSYWNIQSDSGKLIVHGACTVANVTSTRHLRLFGNGDGEWWGNINSISGETTYLDVIGPGTWTLWGTNGYTGSTSVGGGQLNVNGALTASPSVTVGNDILGSGAVLSGTGLITGPVTITGGSTLCGNSVLASGLPSGAPAARLTISNSLTLKSSSTTIVGVSDSGFDQVARLSQVTYGGTLQVVVTGLLVGGEAFKLFDATAYGVADFDYYSLPDLGTILSWDHSSMLVDGTLRVTGSIQPQIGTIGLAGDHNFQLSGTGPTNWTYSILATTNVTQPLSDWVQVDSGTFTDGKYTFTDLHATNYVRRFYRVVTQTQ